jgi:putative phage-type endonuclease
MDEQRSPEWFAARCGKVTASRISDLMAKTKSGGYAASRENYMAQLLVERLTGAPVATYSNAAMQWGTEQEPFARAAYETRMDVLVDEVGFVPHHLISDSGASPDGMVGWDGLVEIKCPNTATAIDTWLHGTVPNEHMLQMQFQLDCTERAWCDYVVFDPRLPEKLQLFVKRIDRDEDLIEKIQQEVIKFLIELNNKLAQLKAKLNV